ncbi:hypothetical protein [Arthrobacter sp. TE12232]
MLITIQTSVGFMSVSRLSGSIRSAPYAGHPTLKQNFNVPDAEQINVVVSTGTTLAGKILHESVRRLC